MTRIALLSSALGLLLWAAGCKAVPRSDSGGGVVHARQESSPQLQALEEVQALLQRGDLPGARDHLQRDVALRPDDAVAWAMLGSTHEQLAEYDEAIYAYQRADDCLEGPQQFLVDAVERCQTAQGAPSPARPAAAAEPEARPGSGLAGGGPAAAAPAPAPAPRTPEQRRQQAAAYRRSASQARQLGDEAQARDYEARAAREESLADAGQ